MASRGERFVENVCVIAQKLRCLEPSQRPATRKGLLGWLKRSPSGESCAVRAHDYIPPDALVHEMLQLLKDMPALHREYYPFAPANPSGHHWTPKEFRFLAQRTVKRLCSLHKAGVHEQSVKQRAEWLCSQCYVYLQVQPEDLVDELQARGLIVESKGRLLYCAGLNWIPPPSIRSVPWPARVCYHEIEFQVPLGSKQLAKERAQALRRGQSTFDQMAKSIAVAALAHFGPDNSKAASTSVDIVNSEKGLVLLVHALVASGIDKEAFATELYEAAEVAVRNILPHFVVSDACTYLLDRLHQLQGMLECGLSASKDRNHAVVTRLRSTTLGNHSLQVFLEELLLQEPLLTFREIGRDQTHEIFRQRKRIERKFNIAVEITENNEIPGAFTITVWPWPVAFSRYSHVDFWRFEAKAVRQTKDAIRKDVASLIPHPDLFLDMFLEQCAISFRQILSADAVEVPIGTFDSDTNVWTLPASLSPFYRFKVHSMAQIYGLPHVSHGQLSDRKLYIARDREALPDRYFEIGESVIIEDPTQVVYGTIADPRILPTTHEIRVCLAAGRVESIDADKVTVVRNPIDHGNARDELPAQISPSEASQITRAQWESNVCLLAKLITFNRDLPLEFWNRFAYVKELVSRVEETGGQVEPTWAGGAKIFIPFLSEGAWSRANPGVTLRPRHVIILPTDVEPFMNELYRGLRYQDRPRMKTGMLDQFIWHPRWTLSTEDASSDHTSSGNQDRHTGLTFDCTLGSESSCVHRTMLDEEPLDTLEVFFDGEVVRLNPQSLHNIFDMAESPLVTPRSARCNSDPG